MVRLLVSIALFGALFYSVQGRMGLGYWESTSEQENLAELLKAIHGDEKVASIFQKNSKIITGWHYDDMADYVHHVVKILPANITSLFSYRPGKPGKVAFGKDIVEYNFEAEGEGETAVLRGKFKILGSDKTWTKDYEFQENGNMKMTAKINDVTATMTFRPTLSERAQGVWEATSEGKNLEKINEVFKGKKHPPREEKYRFCIKREGDMWVKHMNSSVGDHKYKFKVNKPQKFTHEGKEVEALTSYDVALDQAKTTMKIEGEEVEITYTYDNRGAYGTYKKGDVEVQRFYRRIIPDDLHGKFKFAGKEINADAFRKALIGEENTKKNIAGAQTLSLKAKGDSYNFTAGYEAERHMDFDFKLGELGHTMTPNKTRLDYVFNYNTKMGRQVLEGHFFTTDKPNHYFHINFEWEGEEDLVLTYHMDHVVAKRWFKRQAKSDKKAKKDKKDSEEDN